MWGTSRAHTNTLETHGISRIIDRRLEKPFVGTSSASPGSAMSYLTIGVLDRGVLNQLVNLFCVLPIPDGDAKRQKVYTGSGNRHPTSSLRDGTCIPRTEVLVAGGYKLRERGNLSQVSAGCRGAV